MFHAGQCVLDHRVDAVVTRLPIRTDGLHVTVLYDEPRVLLVPLHGVEPSHVVLATRAGDRGRLVTAFRKCAQALLTG